MMAGPNDYELGYDEGYQDGTAVSHELAGLVTERDKWKARAEKAESDLKWYRDYNDAEDRALHWKARAEKAEDTIAAWGSEREELIADRNNLTSRLVAATARAEKAEAERDEAEEYANKANAALMETVARAEKAEAALVELKAYYEADGHD